MVKYDADFYEWTRETARAIEAGRFDEIDRTALADEVESLGNRDRREVRSRLLVILVHLLKEKYQPEKRTRSWQKSIDTQRRELRLVLADSPSLLTLAPELLVNSYEAARRTAANETGLPIRTFPDLCEWSLKEVLDDNGS